MPQQDFVPRGPEAPTYGATPQVAPEALPGVRATVNMPLAAAGGGENVAREFGAVGDLADASAKIAEQSQANADRKQLFDAATQAGLKRNELHMRAESTHGEAVNGLPEAIREEYTKYTDDLASKLPARLQGRFAHIAGTNLVHLDGAVQMHVAHENDQNEQQTYSTAIQTQQNTARLNWKTWDAPDKDNAVDFAAAGAQQAVINFGNSRNMKRELVDAHVAKVTAQTYAGVIEAMLHNDQELTAKKAFDKYSNAGYFDGDAGLKDRLASAVDAGSVKAESQRIEDRIFSTTYDEVPNAQVPAEKDIVAHYVPTSFKEAMDRAREETKNSDPRVKDEVLKRVAHRWDETEKEQQEDSKNNFQNAANAIRDGLAKESDPSAVSSGKPLGRPIDAVGAELWSKLTEQQKEHLESYFTRMTKPEKDVSDERTLTKAAAIQDEDLAKLDARDIFSFRTGFTDKDGNKFGGLDKADYEKLLTRWTGSRKREDSQAFKFTELDERQVFKAVKAAGLASLEPQDTQGGISRDQDKSKAFQDIVNEVKDAYKLHFHDKNKNPNQEDKEKILNDLIVDKVVHRPLSYTETIGKTLRQYGGYGAATGAGWLLGAGLYGIGRALGPTQIPVTDADRKRINKNAGKELSEDRIQMIRQAEMLRASDDELRKLAAEP